MSEMNKPITPREGNETLTNKRFETNPNDAFALAFREALSYLPAEKAAEFLTRLHAEQSSVKGTGADPSPEISKVARHIGGLKSADSGVRQDAARELAAIKDPIAVPALLEALKDKDEWVRIVAAWALGEIGDQKAIAPLRARLNGFLGIFGGERDSDVLDEIKKAIKTLEGN